MNLPSNKHEQSLNILLRYLLGDTPKTENLIAAKEHVAACSSCWQRLLQWGDVLAPTALASFMEESIESFPSGPTFAEVRRLQQEDVPADAIAGMWRRGQAYLARLSPANKVGAVLISLDPRQWSPPLVLAHRGNDETTPTLQITDLPDLETSVSILPWAETSDEVSLLVEISMPSLWPDYSGVRVVLDSSEGKREDVTGPSGRVTFGPFTRDSLSTMHLILFPPEHEDSLSD